MRKLNVHSIAKQASLWGHDRNAVIDENEKRPHTGREN